MAGNEIETAGSRSAAELRRMVDALNAAGGEYSLSLYASPYGSTWYAKLVYFSVTRSGKYAMDYTARTLLAKCGSSEEDACGKLLRAWGRLKSGDTPAASSLEELEMKLALRGPRG